MRIDYSKCMKKKCRECKYYDRCFEYKKEGGNKDVSKSNRQIRKNEFKR